MGQLLMRALAAGGHHAVVASSFRAYDGTGDPVRQQAIRSDAQAEADRLIGEYRNLPAESRPELWFTYHLYYKAPDWIGPTVAQALGIPYVVAEASHAPKRNVPKWRLGHMGTELAIRSARLIFSLTATDKDGILPLLGRAQTHQDLPPFLDPSPFERADLGRPGDRPVRLLTAAMMRPGDKFESYRRLGEYLAPLRNTDWTLTVAGDGPARDTVEAALAPLGPGRIDYLGAVRPEQMPRVYGAADLYVWPAAGEAYGMAMLEAQASGLPVVAARVRGVPDVVLDGQTGFLTPEGDADAFASTVRFLIEDAPARQALGTAAARFVREQRTVDNAANILNRGFQKICKDAISTQ